MNVFDVLKRAFGFQEDRPLGNLTYAQANKYFGEFCQLMIDGAGFVEKESRLPASFDVMKEALMVETLSWWQRGDEFNETVDFMAVGLLRLCNFVPDELVEAALSCTSEERKKLFGDMQRRDRNAGKAAFNAREAALELQELRMRKVNSEWNQFVARYRKVYGER